MGGQNGIFGNLFGPDPDYTSNAFPPAMDLWAQSLLGYPIERDGTTGLPTGNLNTTDTESFDEWEQRSLLNAVNRARRATREDTLGEGWFTAVGWEGVEEVSIVGYLDNAKKHIEDAIEYLLSGDFTVPLTDLGDEWWKPNMDDNVDPSISMGALGSASGSEPDAARDSVIDAASPENIYRPYKQDPLLGVVAYWEDIDPTGIDWLDDSSLSPIDWENTEIIRFMQEFMAAVVDVDVDAIVSKYRAAIESEYTAESQRATSILHLAGAANTSPAALSAWRRTEEIERQVAAFRAELLNRIYPIPDVTNMFGALVNDLARQDSTRLQRNQQILQGNIARMDAHLEAAVAGANNLTQAEINTGQFTTQGAIEEFARNMEKATRLIISGLDARTRIGGLTDNSRIQLAQLLITLYQNMAQMEQQRASVATELRREHQANRLKMLMFRIELAETLMNAATVPLGVPMQPPLPSKFETRVAAGIQTFVNVAGTLAPSGNPALAIGAGLAGAALTTLLPRTIGDE